MKKEPQLKLFPAQEADERILAVIRRHWFTYLLFWFFAFIMLLPILIGVILIPLNLSQISENMVSLVILMGSAYALLVLALLLYGFIDFYLDIYIVTDRRIVDIKQNGFFNRTISELNMHQVQDVKASVKGIFPTLLHYGQVFIQTAGELENFNFTDVPHPYRISKLIMDLHENALDQNDRELEETLEDPQINKSLKNFEEGAEKNNLKPKNTNQKVSDNSSDGNLRKKTVSTTSDQKTAEMQEGQTIKL